jgi:hypothetical protein
MAQKSKEANKLESRKKHRRRHKPYPLNHRKKLGPKSSWRVR